MNEVFVTGTGTGVGKTTVACAILSGARAQGLPTVGIKPIETGCQPRETGLEAADALALGAAAGHAAVCFARYQAPVAPAAIDPELSLGSIVEQFARYRAQNQGVLLVEGAGGVLVPISRQKTMADLMVDLGFPIVVVARDALGTLNHTLLTVESLVHRKLSVAAIVLNDFGNSDPEQKNLSLLQERIAVPVVPYSKQTQPEELFARINSLGLASRDERPR